MSSTKSCLFLLAHPNLPKSRANRLITQQVSSLPHVWVRNLYETSPNFFLDVEAEQKALAQHSLIVFQFPFYWYSVPPLLKLWFDEVLEIGFAFGEKGTALAGKKCLFSFTTGGPATAYREGGSNLFPIDDFIKPWQATANLCRMEWLPHLVLHHASRVEETTTVEHAQKLRQATLENL